jgi:DNA repair protein RecO (recombination protein O)
MDYGEADRILTIMTPQLGKLRVIAKGARKITSRKAGHVELFTRARLLLAHGRTFDIVSQAETIEPYRPLREDLLRGSYAHYLSELIDVFAQEGSEDIALYDLLANGLAWVAETPEPAIAARYFELRLLTLTGYRPQLFRCVRTGEPVNIDTPAAEGQTNSSSSSPARSPALAFSPSEGGMLCEAAAKQARDTMSVSVNTLRLLRALQTEPFEEVSTRSFTPAALGQAEQVMRRYLTFILERNLRSTHFLRQLQSEDLPNIKSQASNVKDLGPGAKADGTLDV